jgi:hypothetical protein
MTITGIKIMLGRKARFKEEENHPTWKTLKSIQSVIMPLEESFMVKRRKRRAGITQRNISA